MEQEHDDEDSIDWAKYCIGSGAPNAEGASLHEYVHHLLSSGISEDSIYDRLSSEGIPADKLSRVIAEVQRFRNQQPDGPDSRPVLLSGPNDVGGIYDNQYERDVGRWERRQKRRERRKKSTRLANTEPDPAFRLDKQPTYAQFLSRDAAKRARMSWLPVILIAVIMLLTLLTVAFLR